MVIEMFHIEGIGNSTFLVYKDKESNIDSFGLGMLVNNSIDGFLNFSCVQKDEDKVLNYNITSMITLEQYMENSLNKERVIHILKSIVMGIRSAEEYMLDIRKILLHKKYIYVEVNGKTCRLVYLPVKTVYKEIDLVNVFKSFFMEFRYDPNDDNAYVTELISYLNNNPQIDYMKFDQKLTEMLDNRGKMAVHVPEHQNMQKQEAGKKQVETETGELSTGNTPKYEDAMQQMRLPVKDNESIEIAPDMDIPIKEEKNKHHFFSAAFGNKRKDENKHDKKKEKQIKAEREKNKKNKETSDSIFPHFDIPNLNVGLGGQKDGDRVNGYEVIPQYDGQDKKHELSIKEMKVPGEMYNVPQMSDENRRYGENRMYGSNSGKKLDFGDTVHLENGADISTTVLISSNNSISDGLPYLVRIKNGQKKYIDKDIIRIGRGKDYADLYIGDNPHIGRGHADIIKEHNEYYIRDNNSQNHTYVNSEILIGGQKRKLEHGMKLQLADEEFVFYMY